MYAFCERSAATAGIPGSAFSYDRSGILVLESAVDIAIQKVMQVALQPTILYLTHHPLLAGHPSTERCVTRLAGRITGPMW